MGTPRVLYINAKNRFCLIFFITAWLKFFALTMPCKSPFTRVIIALSIATSVPVPIAIPTSLLASAGASLIPSPAIATVLPCSCNFVTSLSLSSGSIPALKSARLSSLATAFAVSWLSPVSIITAMPLSCNSLIALALVCLILSPITT